MWQQHNVSEFKLECESNFKHKKLLALKFCMDYSSLLAFIWNFSWICSSWFFKALCLVKCDVMWTCAGCSFLKRPRRNSKLLFVIYSCSHQWPLHWGEREEGRKKMRFSLMTSQFKRTLWSMTVLGKSKRFLVSLKGKNANTSLMACSLWKWDTCYKE